MLKEIRDNRKREGESEGHDKKNKRRQEEGEKGMIRCRKK